MSLFAESKSTIKLTHGDFSATVSAFGAALTSLKFDDQAICVTPEPKHEEWFAGATLAPWPNRLDNATWRMQGQTFEGKVNEFATNTGNHGLVYKRKFRVKNHTASHCTYSYKFGDDQVYPFKVTITVSYALTQAGLKCEITTTNNDSARVPIAFGSHPYFAIDAESALKVEATTSSVVNQRKLPVGHSDVQLLGLKTGEFVKLAKLELDDCLYGFGDKTTTQLTRPDLGLTVSLCQTTPYKYQMLFLRSAKYAGSNPPTLAIEPQTSPPNALVTDTDLLWLEPGASRSATWSVSVSATN